MMRLPLVGFEGQSAGTIGWGTPGAAAFAAGKRTRGDSGVRFRCHHTSTLRGTLAPR
jgi:hypothetical protein